MPLFVFLDMNIYRFSFLGLCLGLFLLPFNRLYSQQLAFTNYTVEHGLAQSQPHDICQDKFGYIWIASLGGISRYDGVSFRNYSKKEGLQALFSQRIFSSKNGQMWFSGKGIVQSFDGRKMYIHKLFANDNAITEITQSGTGELYFKSSSGNLAILTGKGDSYVEKTWQDNAVLAIATNKQNIVHVIVENIGFLSWNNEQWNKIETNLPGSEFGGIVQLFFSSTNNAFILTQNALFKYEANSWNKVYSRRRNQFAFRVVEEDIYGKIWIGTNRGAICISSNGIARDIGIVEGLTNNAINCIKRDREGNLWFASDGTGIYKLNNTRLSKIGQQHGLSGTVVMGLTKFPDQSIWIGALDGGLQTLRKGYIKKVRIPSNIRETQKIHCLFKDSKNRLWIGTRGGGLWLMTGNYFKEIKDEYNKPIKTTVAFAENKDGNIWISTRKGVYYTIGDQIKRVPQFDQSCWSMMFIKPDELIVGSSSGLWHIDSKKKVKRINIRGIDFGAINVLSKFKQFILLGTEYSGILFWDRESNKIYTCNSKNGLASDFIFSIYNDNDKAIYVGTGRGISKVSILGDGDDFFIKNYGSLTDKPYGPECNLNAVVKMPDGKLGFGTTDGILLFNPLDTTDTKATPYIYLQKVELLSKDSAFPSSKVLLDGWNILPNQPSFKHHQNQIGFSFEGLYLTNPLKLRYWCKLEGVDSFYLQSVVSNKVIFSQLAPGHYRFKAYAITESGDRSSNMIDYPFIINKPFYQLISFRILVISILMILFFFIRILRKQWNNKRNALVEYVRLEEQKLIHERTSEDLHDDLGNKITRITVLADVLHKKIDKNEEDKIRIVSQIKENAQLLYLGTKDIILSLEPGNNNLLDLIERCHNFGIHLFDETEIHFIVEGKIAAFREVNISAEFSRNIMMIIKEGLNNVLKHSDATECILVWRLIDFGILEVELKDNGKGFSIESVKAGNGIVNSKKRIARINGIIIYQTSQGKGTLIKLSVKIPSIEG